MASRKAKGNMYGFVTHTKNVIKGKCEYGCVYCYMNVYPLKQIRLVESELKEDLGIKNYYFIGSSCDMFAKSIPYDWIKKVLDYCCKYQFNKYLFQSKNPKRFWEFSWNEYPDGSTFCTTIETNRDTSGFSKAPPVSERANWLRGIPFETMVTIEPIIDFDVNAMDRLIYFANPDFVNIGADSKGHGLPEPSKEKILELIDRLSEFTEVRNKNNLKRLLEKG